MKDKTSQVVGQTPQKDTSPQKTGSEPSKKGIFLKKKKGMPFEEFKKLCIQQFKDEGIIKDKPQRRQ
jgi:hypothetical protein